MAHFLGQALCDAASPGNDDVLAAATGRGELGADTEMAEHVFEEEAVHHHQPSSVVFGLDKVVEFAVCEGRGHQPEADKLHPGCQG